MGASIVLGLMSSDGNGFRLGLQGLLQANHTQTAMVGTQWSGSMSDNHHEAYQAKTIDQYNNISYHSGAYQMDANVILALIGTNDCWYVRAENKSAEDLRFQAGVEAATRFGSLLGSIWTRAPDALVLASGLPRNTNEWCDRCIQGFNSHLPDVVAEAAQRGQQVRWVEMYDVVPADQIQEDGTHPTDFGYQLMAHQYYDAIVNATQELCVEQVVNTTQAGAGTATTSAAGTVSGTALSAPDGNATTQSPASSSTASGADAVSPRHALWMLAPLLLWAFAL
ncbi:hypothetical protein LTR53_013228 [Teratosphaeriaceae sp. CCFEE 6253]|nr:hypothetical protein LTR53_013228 [Teratosphaeriaceae sp. CCFEE 6253]